MSLKAVVHDSREPSWVQAMTFGPDVPVTVTTLPCGDAWLACEDGATIVVERKTIPDLVASLADGRLFGQVAEMVKATDWAYVVVQGKPWIKDNCLVLDGSGTPSGWTWPSVRGALRTVQEMGACMDFLMSNAQEDYRKALIQLANHKRGDVRIKRKREAVLRSPGEEVLCSLPQISDGRAQVLLQHCGSAAYALVHLTGDGGGEISGIGPSIKTSAKFALGLPEWAELTIISTKEEKDEETQNAISNTR